jgi:hypothetical protein
MRVAPLFVLILTLPCLAQEPVAKKMLPDDAAQKTALSVVADVYKPDYEKAKTPAQKIELAKKLLGEGVATKDDPVSRFVLFRVARDIACQQGDFTTAFDAIGRINAEYNADALQMKLDAATAAVKGLKTPKEHQACAAILAPLIDEAIATDRYDHAKSLAELTLGCAREGRDSDRIKQMVAKLKEVAEITAEFEKVKEAKVALEAKPTDPNANFAVGRFLCLVKGDWKRGVTMLALGDNEEFKAAALLELEAQPDSLNVGDVWWKIAEGLEATAKSRAQVHAGEWYRKALPGLSGLTKTRVEKLIAQLPKPAKPKNALEAVDLAANSEGGKWRRTDDGIAADNIVGSSSLVVPGEVPNEYDLHVSLTIQREADATGNDTSFECPIGGKTYPFVIRRQKGQTLLTYWPKSSDKAALGRPPFGVSLSGDNPFKSSRKLTFEVRRESIRLLLDGEPQFTFDRFTEVRANESDKIRLGSWQNRVLFHSVVILPVE